mgnify:CR=1 FL=1
MDSFRKNFKDFVRGNILTYNHPSGTIKANRADRKIKEKIKPKLKSKKVKNLYFTGQLTTPGPGVPPSLISGQVVAKEICKDF